MQIVLLSDIHSNLIALEAVLEVLPTYDQLWCMGDTIGYGPRPNECLDYMSKLGTHVLTGNHDLACIGEVSLVDFNWFARQANEWNNRQLQDEPRAYLKQRPAKITSEPDATLAHASPRDPIWEYILDVDTATENLDHFTSSLCLVGHTHVPTLFARHPDGRIDFEAPRHDQVLELLPGSRYIVNPGSVGQPRDGDPRASYALWDTEARTIRYLRIGYDIGGTQLQMRQAGLPEPLAERLAMGR